MSKSNSDRDHFDVLVGELETVQLLELIHEIGWTNDPIELAVIDRLQKVVESHVAKLEKNRPYSDNPLGRNMLETMKDAAPGSHWHKTRDDVAGYKYV